MLVVFERERERERERDRERGVSGERDQRRERETSGESLMCPPPPTSLTDTYISAGDSSLVQSAFI